MKRPPHKCAHYSCKALIIEGSYCPDHIKKPFDTVKDKDRPSAAKRGYGRRWQRATAIYLRSRPQCAICGHWFTSRKDAVVDHIIPHKGDMTLFWDQNNWQPVCRPCHTAKTLKEARDGITKHGNKPLI